MIRAIFEDVTELMALAAFLASILIWAGALGA